ncbi:MAG: shikimate kinase [Actinomycetota bacterium]|nr:shikimate kinase [Actinomycetota bacterium]
MADPGDDRSFSQSHVVLVGMMGVGKTTVGKRVAKLLERPFVDADAELVRRSGRAVADWFATAGESGFRSAESDVLADLLARPEPLILAAGGGVVVEAGNRDRLQRPDAFVVWLRADPSFLAARVARKAHRPLIAADPVGTLTRLATERGAWYGEVADAVIDVAPVHAREERPKWALAEQVSAAVLAHDAAGSVGR